MFPYEYRQLTPVAIAAADAATPNKIVRVPFFSRGIVNRLIVVGSGAFNATLYSRAFTTIAADIPAVTSNGGKLQLLLTTPHGLRVGDTVTIAGSSEVGCNASHVVLSVESPTVVTLDFDFTSAPATTGNWRLNIPSTDWPLYEVCPVQAASSNVVRMHLGYGYQYGNQDVPTIDGQVPKYIYLALSVDGTYQWTVAGTPTA